MAVFAAFINNSVSKILKDLAWVLTADFIPDYKKIGKEEVLKAGSNKQQNTL